MLWCITVINLSMTVRNHTHTVFMSIKSYTSSIYGQTIQTIQFAILIVNNSNIFTGRIRKGKRFLANRYRDFRNSTSCCHPLDRWYSFGSLFNDGKKEARNAGDIFSLSKWIPKSSIGARKRSKNSATRTTNLNYKLN